MPDLHRCIRWHCNILWYEHSNITTATFLQQLANTTIDSATDILENCDHIQTAKHTRDL
jgi:hypothetical protein